MEIAYAGSMSDPFDLNTLGTVFKWVFGAVSKDDYEVLKPLWPKNYDKASILRHIERMSSEAPPHLCGLHDNAIVLVAEMRRRFWAHSFDVS